MSLMTHDTTEYRARIMDVIDEVIRLYSEVQGFEPGYRNFCQHIGTYDNAISEFKTGRTQKLNRLIYKTLIDTYKVNPEFIENGTEPMFLRPAATAPPPNFKMQEVRVLETPAKVITPNDLPTILLPLPTRENPGPLFLLSVPDDFNEDALYKGDYVICSEIFPRQATENALHFFIFKDGSSLIGYPTSQGENFELSFESMYEYPQTVRKEDITAVLRIDSLISRKVRPSQKRQHDKILSLQKQIDSLVQVVTELKQQI